MRVLTAVIAAAWVVVACRGRETIEPPEAVEAAEEPLVAPVEDSPTVEYIESVTTVERRSTESSTSIEIIMPSESRTMPEPIAPVPRTCCRTCRTGRACGDTCIAANRECHTSPGCACDE